ncbi:MULTISPECIES: hypothetical protein [unclassified Streptomyces]|uniref:hypothetical protein n=1 Tax=unclassified Streptomyces TaxID=2593676 RepID=UPI0036E0176C
MYKRLLRSVLAVAFAAAAFSVAVQGDVSWDSHQGVVQGSASTGDLGTDDVSWDSQPAGVSTGA